MARIDLNSDLGESFGAWTIGDDAGVLERVTSANVACGFHAGDPVGILRTCGLASARGVVIGAHPGYRDLAGFGRRFIDCDPDDLCAEIVYQIGALQALAGAAGASVRYVKPHGALYHAIIAHEGQAGAVVRAVETIDPSLPIVVPPSSAIGRIARDRGIRTVVEAFADRCYRSDGTLVPRSDPRAVLTPDAAIAQAVGLATTGLAVSVDGIEVEVSPETICVHGDTPAAVRLAGGIRAELELAGVEIADFVGGTAAPATRDAAPAQGSAVGGRG